jgi:hypothetical protein
LQPIAARSRFPGSAQTRATDEEGRSPIRFSELRQPARFFRLEESMSPNPNAQGCGKEPTTNSRTALSSERVERLADLIAEGRYDVPVDMHQTDLAKVEDATRRRLRERLLQWIARAIAHRLHRANLPSDEEPAHA